MDRGSLGALLAACRSRLFFHLKRQLLRQCLHRSGTRAKKADDDYDYPEDLPQVVLNRPKAAAARGRRDPMARLSASLFGQLFSELHFQSPAVLRIAYTHPMDDGQQRSFKVKFEGEGVDDYGGPYRECFAQVATEVQAVPPDDDNDEERESSYKRPGAGHTLPYCVLPLLRPAPNLNGGPADETAGTRFVLNPSTCMVVPPAGAGSSKRNNVPHALSGQQCGNSQTGRKRRGRFRCPAAVDRGRWARAGLYLEMYSFLGQLVGVALRNNISLPLELGPLAWKVLVGERIRPDDLRSVDASAADLFARLRDIGRRAATRAKGGASKLGDAGGSDDDDEGESSADEEELDDLRWTTTLSDGTEVELCPGGRHERVSRANAGAYAQAALEARLAESRPAAMAMRHGLSTVVPQWLLPLFTWEELRVLIGGQVEVDVDLLQCMTEYDDDVSPDEPHMRMFWRVLHGFSTLERSAFLRFVWARSRLPASPDDFKQKFKLQAPAGDGPKNRPDEYLPKAHTCFFSLNLPKYSSAEVMRTKLLYAIHHCVEMDADFRLAESEMTGWDQADMQHSAMAQEHNAVV